MLDNDKKEERWLKLCEEAAVEQDSKKLLDLIAEISALLEEKHKRSVPQKPENERAAINEIITAIEDLSASVVLSERPYSIVSFWTTNTSRIRQGLTQ